MKTKSVKQCGAAGPGVMTVLSMSLAMVGNVANAQVSAEQQAPKAQGIQEVVVTAERRSAGLQSTPLAISAMKGEDLADKGISSIENVQDLIPGFTVGHVGGNTLFNIRGIGTSNPAADQAVSFNIDGVNVGQSYGTSGMFFDIERVEVLRGPQGTLYGRNASAGSVNVITNKPAFVKEGDASVEFGNYGMVGVKAMYNLPLNDQWAIRAAVNTMRHTGHMDNGGSDADQYAARVQALYKPSSQLSVRLAADTAHEGGYGTADTVAIFFPQHAWHSPWSTDGTGHHLVHSSVSAEATWVLGNDVDLTYLGARRSIDRRELTAFPGSSFSPSPTAANPKAIPIPTIGQTKGDITEDSNDFTTTSHELRLASTAKSGFKWVAGLYSYLEEGTETFIQNYVSVAPPGSQRDITNYPMRKNRSYAAFAQGTIPLSDDVRLTLGGRYTKEEKVQKVIDTHGNTIDQSHSWQPKTYKAGLEWDVSRSSLAYASVSTGFKAGGFFVAPAPSPTSFAPENVRAYALGSKNRFLHNTVQINAEAFYNNYTNFQASSLQFLPTGLTLVTFNAEKARTWGLELDNAWMPTADDKFEMTLAYLNARYVNYIAPGISKSVNWSGYRMPGAPGKTVTLGYSHKWWLESGARLTAGAQTRLVSHYSLNVDPTIRAAQQAGYMKSSVNLGYANADGNYTVNAYVRNLEQVAVLSRVVVAGPNADVVVAEPRTFGVTLGVHF
jgi:iron complex outermembrane receptor protein